MPRRILLRRESQRGVRGGECFRRGLAAQFAVAIPAVVALLKRKRPGSN